MKKLKEKIIEILREGSWKDNLHGGKEYIDDDFRTIQEIANQILELLFEEEIIKIEKNISEFTGLGSEYNRGRADGYYERNSEILDLLKLTH